MKKWIVGLMIATSVSVSAQELVMGYPDTDKLPLIGPNGDNSGAYLDLYTEAAKQMGMTLKVVRMPKKRVHEGLKDGSIDFYPGASFDKDRTEYMMWIENGFETKEVCLTPDSVADIKDLSKAGSLTLLAELGGSKTKLNEKFSNLKVTTIENMGIDKIMALFKGGRGNLFILDIEEVDYFQKKNGADVYTKNNVRVHYDCLETAKPMYLGFSRKSSKYKEMPNANFKSGSELNYTNLPTMVDPASLAGKLGVVLKDLKAKGVTDSIHKKHFK